MRSVLRIVTCILLFPLGVLAQEGQQKFAELGDFKLESGQVIRDLRVGYRTFGQLNHTRSNAILFPTWFGATSEQMQTLVGPGKLADTSTYFIILADALGNGVSSSPSNSQQQPRMRFPRITLRDMVDSQYQLVTKTLNLQHLKGVIGISMGGMQTFQWMVSYPTFMEKAIPIVGSPRLAPYDLLLWQTSNDAIRNDPIWNSGEYTQPSAQTALFELGDLLGTTPQHYNKKTKREEVLASIAEAKKKSSNFDANNHIYQAEAMMALDVTVGFSGSIEKAAAAVKAKVLVVVSKTDHIVTPGPALDFAHRLGANILELQGDCGHAAFSCEAERIESAVKKFLIN